MEPDGESDGGGYLLILSGLALRAFPLHPGRVVIGRAPEADIRLDHREVSRRHCEIEHDRDGFWITDLGSQWGTRIGPAPVRHRTRIHKGDVLALGGVQLLFDPGVLPSPEEMRRRAGEAETTSSEGTSILYRGQPARHIPLAEGVSLGRDPASGVVLNSPAVSRHHAAITRAADGYRIADLQSTAGSFVNGRRFDEHRLVLGDRIQIGPFHFSFDGMALDAVAGARGAAVSARGIGRTAPSGRRLLEDVSLEVAPGRFAGIIGPSGAGKSSLLGVLVGMAAPDGGHVLVDGAPVSAGGGAERWGFVPQEEIVHCELTVSQALDFAARLRFHSGTPSLELRKLVVQTMDQLGLRERAATRIGDLSGGQRKRVSVAAELLARPPVLFLDEPTSGLDPATEFKLMELLRDLADRGCTVLCTTHVMENVYLMDQLMVMSTGRMLYSGTPGEARDFFGVQRLATLYDKLDEKPAAEWIAAAPPPPPAIAPAAAPPRRAGPGALTRLRVLLGRQWAIHLSDWRNPALLAGQPLVLAALVAWVSSEDSLRLFFAYIAALWFGCSNGSQEIVREWPIYRRERIAGVTPGLYLLGKLLFLGGATAAQASLFYTMLKLLGGVAGDARWQLAALLLVSGAAVSIGTLISTLARNLMQAVLAVPLVLIPFILFSGQEPSAAQLEHRGPWVARAAAIMPSHAAQRCMDLSFFWQRRLDADVTRGHEIAYRNLPAYAKVGNGEVFTDGRPGWAALGILTIWMAGTAAATWLALRWRERW